MMKNILLILLVCVYVFIAIFVLVLISNVELNCKGLIERALLAAGFISSITFFVAFGIFLIENVILKNWEDI